MTKNMFEETNLKRITIFDSIKHEQKNKPNHDKEKDKEKDSLKTSKKSSNSNSFKENNTPTNTQSKSGDMIREVQETGAAKSKKHNGSGHSNGSGGGPTMYKIALKLRRLTENKMKKSRSETKLDAKSSLKEDLSARIDTDIKEEKSKNEETSISDSTAKTYDPKISYDQITDTDKTGG